MVVITFLSSFILLVNCVAASMPDSISTSEGVPTKTPDDWSVIERIAAGLKAGYTLNEDQPPVGDIQSSNGEATCSERVIRCSTTYFGTTQTILDISGVDVEIVNHVDANVINTEDFAVKLISSKSTAVTSEHTEGWHIGATANLNHNFQAAQLSIEYGYSESDSTGTSVSTSTTYEAPCEAGETCYIETVTFNFKLQGTCSNRPYYVCDGKYYLCEEPYYTTCPQYDHYHEESCTGETAGNRTGDCTVSTPILDNAGKLLSFVVIRSELNT